VAVELASSKTPESAKAQKPTTPPRRWPSWIVPTAILILAALLLFTIRGNWDAWTGGAAKQTTDDAYVHAGLTPLSTKVSGVVAAVCVNDCQHGAGDVQARIEFPWGAGNENSTLAICLAEKGA